MAIRTFYGSKAEIREVEGLLKEIDAIQFPVRENQMVLIKRGLEKLKSDLQQEQNK